MTGDAADLTDDPIVNLQDAHLIALYLHRASAGREERIHGLPEPQAHVTASTPDNRRGDDSYA